METEEKKKKKVVPFIVAITGILLLGGIGLWKMNENRKLQRKLDSAGTENERLRGEVRGLEKQNRRLSHENNNLNYQLGKVVGRKEGSV